MGRREENMKLTKKVVVNGQELEMSSLDGRSWFLRPESMYEFEKRMRQTPKMTDEDFEGLDIPPTEEDLLSVEIAD